MPSRASGFSYVEVMLALVLLAVCLVPAMNAVRDATIAPKIALQGAQALACLRMRMETVAAEPYQLLLNAAGAPAAPSVYSLAADLNCPARDVMISRYDPDTSPYFMSADTGLLYLAVSTRGAIGAPPMTLTTMVAR
jgi:Tfp pilus assembly protein PilV